MSKQVARWAAALAVLAGGAALPSATASADQAPASRQQEKQFVQESPVPVKFNYLLYLPKEYGKEDKVWPLLVFLHGSGETGSNVQKVTKHGLPKLIKENKEFPFVVVSPQAPRRGWRPEEVNALIDDVAAKYKVDKDRIYLTGLSMGGYGTWALAAAHPEKFAAIAPICGGGDPTQAAKLKDLPIWVFHGAKDPTVPVRKSEEMVKALKEAGAKHVKFTVYPNAAHDSWTATYNNPELFQWLLKQKRSGGKKE